MSVLLRRKTFDDRPRPSAGCSEEDGEEVRIYVDIDFFDGFEVLKVIIRRGGFLEGSLREMARQCWKNKKHDAPQLMKHYLVNYMEKGILFRANKKRYELTPRFKKSIKESR